MLAICWRLATRQQISLIHVASKTNKVLTNLILKLHEVKTKAVFQNSLTVLKIYVHVI